MSLLKKFKSLLKGGKLDVKSRFELLREAVSGSMSKFYMARDRKTGQVVGLKILDPKQTAAFESRFVGLSKPSEGEIGQTIDHPRIAKTLEYGKTTTGKDYILMQYIEGAPLNALLLNRSDLFQGNRVRLIRHMAETIGAVHDAGFIHHDVCPRNFVLSPDGKSLTLIDFGLSVPATKEFMHPGNRTGTPNYMAPEVVRHRPTDQRLDIFAMGVSAYELCTYELPWPHAEHNGKAALLHDTIPAVKILDRCERLNEHLAETIMQCIASDPGDRPTCGEFLRTVRGLTSEYA